MSITVGDAYSQHKPASAGFFMPAIISSRCSINMTKPKGFGPAYKEPSLKLGFLLPAILS